MSRDSSTNSDAQAASGASPQAQMARAFQELARGEQHAAAMEANLSKLEEKLDAMLAQFEQQDAVSGVLQKKPADLNKDEDEKKV